MHPKGKITLCLCLIKFNKPVKSHYCTGSIGAMPKQRMTALRNPSLNDAVLIFGSRQQFEILSKPAARTAEISGVSRYSPAARMMATARATSTRGRRPSRRPSRRRAPWPPTPRTAAASAAWRSASPPHPPQSHRSAGGAGGRCGAAAGSRPRALDWGSAGGRN